MAIDKYGYRYGPRYPQTYGVDSTSNAIAVGDVVTEATAGYVKKASAGDRVFGVAMEAATAGSADGDVKVQVDVSPYSVYEYPPDAGSVTVALIHRTMDLGGARSIDIDASADDDVYVENVDTSANTLFVRLVPYFQGVA